MWRVSEVKVHIFWEGHKFLRNLHLRIALYSNGQIYGCDFTKCFGLLMNVQMPFLWLKSVFSMPNKWFEVWQSMFKHPVSMYWSTQHNYCSEISTVEFLADCRMYVFEQNICVLGLSYVKFRYSKKVTKIKPNRP